MSWLSIGEALKAGLQALGYEVSPIRSDNSNDRLVIGLERHGRHATVHVSNLEAMSNTSERLANLVEERAQWHRAGAVPTSPADRLDLVQSLLNPPKAEDGSQPAPLQGNGTNVMGPLRIDASIPVRDDPVARVPPPLATTECFDGNEFLKRALPLPATLPHFTKQMRREMWRSLGVSDELGPGIAAKDVTPKAPDYSAWCDETDLLPDAEG